MCTETTRFLAGIETMDPIEARRQLMELRKQNPHILATQKGISLARPVMASLLLGVEPTRPTLLAATDKPESPWEVTKAFLRSFRVRTIEELEQSHFLQSLGAQVRMEEVTRTAQMTPVEMTYSEVHISLPAVRVHFLPPVDADLL